MRLLLGPGAPREVEPGELAALYARPDDLPEGSVWVRASMVSTLDGAATGPDGDSGGINNEPDHAVFDALRDGADAILVGAGTARAEGYGGAAVPIVVVSRRGSVPETLRGLEPGRVVLATASGAEHLGEAEALLGADHVWLLGESDVDLAAIVPRLAERGWRTVTCEGGPSLLGDLLAAGVVDEVCASVVPRLLAGDLPRMTTGPVVDRTLELLTLLEHDSTLLGRWRVR